ncbi:hypothetical protein FCL48_24460 [Desulforhopalus sp. IMCC35007]|nr:hypothetical protein FCL48_24460 [Desulforhopalus sp. IMCC35007]
MRIEEYFSKLNSESQFIFNQSLAFREKLGKTHHFSSCVYEFAQNIYDESEKEILKTVSSQLESATFTACLGMYRQASASLRLALEMGLAAAYFSAHKMDLHEWLNGDADIKWTTLIDPDNGVLSSRFTSAFFEEFSQDSNHYLEKSKCIYRALSEFVHGNNDTWAGSGIELKFDKDCLERYFEYNGAVCEIILFVLSCRYLKSFSYLITTELQPFSTVGMASVEFLNSI